MAATDVIVGLDDSNSAAEALSWATHYARLNKLRLLAVHVSPFLADLPPDWAPENPAYDPRTDDELGPIAVRSRATFEATHPEPGWGWHVVGGPPGRVLVEIARDARLLALGARKHTGVGRLLAGSVSHYSLSHSTVPVAAVPAQDAEGVPTRSDEIVLGLDDSPSGLEALTWAAGLARTWADAYGPSTSSAGPGASSPSTIRRRRSAISSTEQVDQEYRASIADLYERVEPQPGWLLQFAEGHPGKVLVEQSTSSALLVVGTQEQAGLGRLLLGSVSHYALNHANCPVVAVPASHSSHTERTPT